MYNTETGNERVLALVGKKIIKPETLYRFSQYTLSHNQYLYNTLTDAIVKLNEDEAQFLSGKGLMDNDCELNGCIIGQDVIDHGLEELIRRAFMVETETDETEIYLSAVNVMKLMQGKKPGIRLFTILPTTACNARCVYCFEQGIQYVTMDKKRADQVVEFIRKTKYDGKIRLRWFGGEPLAANGIISHICRDLQETGTDYSSTMITNASLFTPELVHTAKELWRLKSVQVSLDGYKEDYENRKNYIDREKYNYDTVMKAIHWLLDERIKVKLRCNYDEENLSRVSQFIADVHNEFGNNENLSLYLSLLYQKRDKEESIKLVKKAALLRDLISDLGIKWGRDRVVFQTHRCMADSEGESVVINADGKLYRCEHLIGECGHIDQQWNGYHLDRRVESECSKCLFLPLCTSFVRKGCPSWNSSTCKEMMRLDTVYYLDHIDRISHQKIKGELTAPSENDLC